MIKLHHAGRIQIGALAFVLCVTSVVLLAAVMAHTHARKQGDGRLTQDSQRTPVASPPGVPGLTIPQMLQEINAHLNPRTDSFLNTERTKMLHAALVGSSTPVTFREHVNTNVMYADELLNAGKLIQGIQEFQLIERQIRQYDPDWWTGAKGYLRTREAIGYMRLGEQQNCCASNNAYSCLLPISGPGIHTRQYGSRHAIQCLTQILQDQPKDLEARWLLNIAYMTVGGYPHAVPPKWLIPLKLYGGDCPMRKFTNAAPRMGLDLLGWSGSVVMEDFEGNGLLDLLISSQRQNGPLRYFRNNGDGTFTERTKEAGLTGEVGGLNMITTDYNNDGKPDVVVLRGGWVGADGHDPLSLLRNDGRGHFTDVTLQAGLLTLGPTQTAVAFDYDGDGKLDLFVGYESTPGDPVPCKLFHNNGNGTFTDVTQQCGLNITRFVKAVVSADYTHSGRPGLYLSCHDGPNILLRNDGPASADRSPGAPWKFTDVSDAAGVSGQHGSFSCLFFDYDNDGWPDIYVNGYRGVNTSGDIAADYLGLPTMAEKARLYRNNHDGTFTDVTKQAHLNKVVQGMGINYGDLDNDGWLDFYVGTGDPDLGTLVPNRMFRNHDGKFFDEVTTTGDFGHLQKGHGIAFGDLNNNGQEDIFEVMGGAYEGDSAHDVLYVNPGSRNHWVTLQLEGVRSNRIALGAQICVTAATPGGERKIYRTVSTGGELWVQPTAPGDRPGGRDGHHSGDDSLASVGPDADAAGPDDGPLLQGPGGRLPCRPLAGADVQAADRPRGLRPHDGEGHDHELMEVIARPPSGARVAPVMKSARGEA